MTEEVVPPQTLLTLELNQSAITIGIRIGQGQHPFHPVPGIVAELTYHETRKSLRAISRCPQVVSTVISILLVILCINIKQHFVPYKIKSDNESL